MSKGKDKSERFYCYKCELNFNGVRDYKFGNAMRCPKCKSADGVVKFNHPFIKIFKNLEAKQDVADNSK